MNFKKHYEINEPLFMDITNDIEQIIKENTSHQREDIVRRRWLIGEKISLEEVRFFHCQVIPEAVLKYVSDKLKQKYGNEYSLRNLQDDYIFYNEHLNLFKEYSRHIYPPLSWSKYQAIMKIPDLIDRQKWEMDTRKNNWTIKDLRKQIRLWKLSSFKKPADQATGQISLV